MISSHFESWVAAVFITSASASARAFATAPLAGLGLKGLDKFKGKK